MKKYILLLLVCFSVSMVAQRDEIFVKETTEEFTKQLLDRGITKFFTTKRYCLGKTEVFKLPNDSICFSRGTYVESYILWEEHERFLMKKIDNCGLFQTVLLDDNEVYIYFAENTEALKVNQVKPYKIKKQANAPLLRTAIHSCRRAFTFYDGESVMAMAFNTWDLESNVYSENLNYEYNDALEVVELDYLMDDAIESMESNVKYKRMKYTPPSRRRPSRN